MSENTHEAHTGPIQNPKQLLVAVFFSFVVPIFLIIGLVFYVVSANKPAGTKEGMELGGVTAQSVEAAKAHRLAKVGGVEIRDANRPLRPGEEVFNGQCKACHGPQANVPGAPHLGDAAAWGPRIKAGFDALVASALKGKGGMPPQAGGDFEDLEIARAVAYMANAGGAKFAEPQRPAASAAAGAAPAASAAAPAASAAK